MFMGLLAQLVKDMGRVLFAGRRVGDVTLIFGFGVNLNLLALFLLFRNIGLNIPSRLNSWLNFKNKSSPLVLTRFPDINICLWKEVNIDGKLLLHH